MRMMSLVALAVAAAPHSATALEFSEANPAELAAAEAALAETIAESTGVGAAVTLLVGRTDLDDDGNTDMLVMVQSGYLCGDAGGCPIAVMRALPDGGFAQHGFVWGARVDAQDNRTGGWSDLLVANQIGETIMRWNGSEYAN